MEWIVIIIVALVVLYVLFIRRKGRLDFWKLAAKYPDLAYEFFQKEDCWFVFEEKPEDGYSNNLPPGEWDGPFFHRVPKLRGKLVSVFGKVPDYENAQQAFIDGIEKTRLKS